jgi:hypothetical protein
MRSHGVGSDKSLESQARITKNPVAELSDELGLAIVPALIVLDSEAKTGANLRL